MTEYPESQRMPHTFSLTKLTSERLDEVSLGPGESSRIRFTIRLRSQLAFIALTSIYSQQQNGPSTRPFRSPRPLPLAWHILLS